MSKSRGALHIAKAAKAKVYTKIPNAPFEISYNAHGLMLCLSISYRTEVKSAFVDRIEAIFTHCQTNETHTLEAQNFLEYSHDPSGRSIFPQLRIIGPFAPFGITMERYENKIILFNDPIAFEQINTILNSILDAKFEARMKLPYERDGVFLEENQVVKYNEIVEVYNSRPEVVNAWAKVRDDVYLRPGRYRVVIRSYVDGQQIESPFEIEITTDQFELLRNNAFAITRLHKYLKPHQYQSVYPRILDSSQGNQAVIRQFDNSRPKISA